MSTPVAVVTGSNKGIGLAIVRALCKQFQGDVYLTARNKERGLASVKLLESEGLKPKFHLLDVSDQESINVLKDFLVKQYGGVNVFIHNAGFAYKNADPTSFAIQARVTIDANFYPTINLANTILPIMKDYGRYVNVSSMVTLFSLEKCSKEVQDFFKSDDMTEEKLIAKLEEFISATKSDTHQQTGFSNSAYGMSKLGVTAFTRVLGKRVKAMDKQNVLVNCCCPGWVRTDMAGDKAPLTPDQGAENPIMIALIPKGQTEPNGEFIQEKQVKKWYK